MRIPLFVTLCSIVVFSCSNHRSFDEKIVRDSIHSVLERQIAGWNSGSIETFMDGYVRNDSLRFASGGSVTYGWTTMLGRYRKGYPSPEAMGVLEFSGISITVISPEAAVVFGTWTLRRNADTPAGLFTLLFRKINGSWRIVHDHTSSAEKK
jgi:hypothetical protein